MNTNGQAITACARADDPLAFGIDRLRQARITLAAELQAIDASEERLANAPQRGRAELEAALARVDDALDHTRSERVRSGGLVPPRVSRRGRR